MQMRLFYIHAQKLIRLMQRCWLNDAWTMLLSRFNSTCWIDNVDEYCSINSCSMLTEKNSCYNVVTTWADNSWWKNLVDRCQQWLNNGCWTWTAVEQWLLTTAVVDRVQHYIVEQCAAQHCNKLLTTLTKLFIFARVIIFYFNRHGNELYVM